MKGCGCEFDTAPLAKLDQFLVMLPWYEAARAAFFGREPPTLYSGDARLRSFCGGREAPERCDD